MARQKTTDNPLKDHAERKDTTRRLSDKATPRSARARKSDPDTSHPSQRGGVTSLDRVADPRNRPAPERAGTQTEGPGPAKAPARSRVGPQAAGKSRSGKTKNSRRTGRPKGR